MMTISTVDRIRLEALLGMLGSDHAGERENAAKLVEQFRRQRGLNWGDLLAKYPASTRLSDGPPRTVVPRVIPGPVSGRQDAVWRWSLLAGLLVVGSIAVTSLAEQHGASARTTSEPFVDPGCMAASECGTVAAPPPVAEPTVAAVPQAFVQGRADRKVWEAWHKSGPAALCSGHLGAGQDELKAACVTARKLLVQFETRRRADLEYRRGWNSLPL